jgi:hypothetical protein
MLAIQNSEYPPSKHTSIKKKKKKEEKKRKRKSKRVARKKAINH